MANVLNYLPELEPDEAAFIQGLFQSLSEQQAQQYADIYRMRRKKPELVLFTALIGFLGFAGVHRFIVGDIGWGILYFFTGGLCFVGTIVDAIKYRSIAFDANIKEAQRTYALVAGQTGGRY